MINLTLHEELLAESRASSHCTTTPQVLQARALCTQQPVPLALASLASSSAAPWYNIIPPPPSPLPLPPNNLSCVAPSCLSLAHYYRRCGNVVLADAELTQVLSIPPAWSQRHSTWPPRALLTLVMGTAILSTILGLSPPEGNDWQVPIPATGLLQRCTTCAQCTALAEQMTRTP